jgi:hypothetical protein
MRYNARWFAVVGLLTCLPGGLIAQSDAGGQPAERRLEAWQQRTATDPIPTNLSFGRVIPDAEVRQFLQRHSLRPIAIYMSAAGEAGSHRVSPAKASAASVAEARQVSMEMLRRSQAALRVRARRFVEQHSAEQMDTAAGAAQRAKALVAAFDRDNGLTRVLNGSDPIIYGVRVLGTVSSVRAALQDPLVAQGEPAMLVNGRVSVPSLRIPEALQPQGIRPGSVPGSGRDAYQRLQQIAQNP